MKKIIFAICVFLLSAGCESLRFAPDEVQKQNAWLHNRTAAITAQKACDEYASEELQSLSRLGEIQSRAFVSYFGLPKELPQAETAEDILAASNMQITEAALQSAAERPDGWQIADAALELGIGIFALLGGVYGTQTVRFLRQAKTKTKALQEIIAGNELFKQQNTTSVAAFKQAQANQSPETRQIVAQLKA
ncbi:MAG: hypothetical protein JW715_15645 [Sedimentisphaerales bacterium]|nr:hypothetical protein [Sedimentisphaerales bacterium]